MEEVNPNKLVQDFFTEIRNKLKNLADELLGNEDHSLNEEEKAEITNIRDEDMKLIDDVEKFNLQELDKSLRADSGLLQRIRDLKGRGE